MIFLFLLTTVIPPLFDLVSQLDYNTDGAAVVSRGKNNYLNLSYVEQTESEVIY